MDSEREALLVGEVVGVGMGVEKDRREETPTGKGRARKKYASEGQQLVGTATSTGNVRGRGSRWDHADNSRLGMAYESRCKYC